MQFNQSIARFEHIATKSMARTPAFDLCNKRVTE